jgi:hypothetical protein
VAGPAPLRINLFGGFGIAPDGGAPPRAPSARQQQLIAFLILHARSSPVPRQRVAGSLWPESTDVQALTNLRRELHHLREGWPDLDAGVDASSRTLAWRADTRTIVDLVAFDADAERGLAGDRAALASAAALYTGDVLPEHRHVEGTHLSSAEIDDFRAPREEEARGLSIASFDRFMELRRGDTIDRGLELWPALESIRARDNEPRIVQGEALWCGGAIVGRDFGHCVRRQRPIRVEQFLGLTLQLLKIGVLSRIRRVGGF